ncbi:hypothetical protein PsorP6_002067 [Peronosclerospora sorghi]|uniref:Uncharacterized protein n=1 Tax=Peronosclerospora sorghi TaxID=230839 RepID=A0ACC0WV98_9STRA|nr:hypothetical protein PsorP6_002067 [Peronosclerospora sorghi]
MRFEVCKSIVSEVETQLNNTQLCNSIKNERCNSVVYLHNMQDDYDIDVVFRISETKKRIKYSRSEARILEVLDSVCEHVPIELPGGNPEAKRMVTAAVHRAPNCNDFIGEYEDEFTRTFFDDFTPAQERMCVTTLQVCKTLKISKTEEL